VAHALIFAAGSVEKRVTFPSHLEGAVGEVVEVDIFTGQLCPKSRFVPK
jgi:hypothetical protein